MIFPAMRVETSGIWIPRGPLRAAGAASEGGDASGSGAGADAAPGAGRLIAVMSAVSHTRPREHKEAPLSNETGASIVRFHARVTAVRQKPYGARCSGGALSGCLAGHLVAKATHR